MTHTLESLLKLAETEDGLDEIHSLVCELSDGLPTREINQPNCQFEEVMHYAKSLDAMAEARKASALSRDERRHYAGWLETLTEAGHDPDLRSISDEGVFMVLDALPLQHAIAFILTKKSRHPQRV